MILFLRICDLMFKLKIGKTAEAANGAIFTNICSFSVRWINLPKKFSWGILFFEQIRIF